MVSRKLQRQAVATRFDTERSSVILLARKSLEAGSLGTKAGARGLSSNLAKA